MTRIIYPTFVRLHLEFASSVWSPHLEYDSKTLESVQRRGTLTKERTTPSALRKKTIFNGPENKTRRGDFIQIYKIVHGLEKVNLCDEIKILRPEQNTTGRRHPFQFCSERTSGNEPRIHFLLNRMATPWNNLPKKIALAHSVNSFKSKLELHLNKVARNTQIYS